MNSKGFIFDLDGVIVDTAKYHFLAWKKLAETIGVTFTETENEQLKGVSRVRSLEKILEWGNKTLDQDTFMELMARKNNDYLAYINTMNTSEILPDVTRVLLFLKEQNQRIALGSASKNARAILKKVALFSNFEAIVDGTNVTKAKPNPEVFLKAAQQLGINAEKCIVFEDSVAGIQAANTAGMISIGIGNKEILSEATYVFKNFTEMSNEFLLELIVLSNEKHLDSPKR
ncbi:beta-phosphoglucomutase [Cochleicola gelatinilyticus]|uniref:Beta-phosphoglucomutase n=1 Tax=Cochleicola gelatinilyticus TaxID=1763537 RepID=A0A167HKF2_9FLAO|nr:beta-phosphoglucomutase [Cochleicola gelatinilyticus]OAB78706.1 beta-phosphoglucomutase [Cochleicola gelatinilyticus]